MKLPILLILVRVLNPAGVPTRTVSEAERSAASIFADARVEIRWVNCDTSSACGSEPGPTEFWLHLLSRQPRMLPADAMGFALLTSEPGNQGSYAAVAWPTVRQLSDELRSDPGAVLGAAVAHELGHLLLGSRSHSRDGVMMARLGNRQLAMAARGELLFNDAQAEAIREEIRRRGGER